MKNLILKILPFVLVVSISTLKAQEARQLISKVIDANGGKDALNKLKDVSYDYTFMVKDNKIEDISKERYIFNGEVSFAEYTKREVYALPQMPGKKYVQFFNGSKTTSIMDGKVITAQQPAFFGHILRKTNYYWFTMMFKLLDPGVHHKMLPTRTVDGTAYKIVEMTFGENIGESSQDKYILYINPTTHRIDQFLYSATGFGVTEPSIMKVNYEKIDGVYVSTYRKYAPADWNGNKKKGPWTEQYTTNVNFNNGYTLENIKN